MELTALAGDEDKKTGFTRNIAICFTTVPKTVTAEEFDTIVRGEKK